MTQMNWRETKRKRTEIEFLPVTLWPCVVVRTGFVLLLVFSGRIRRIRIISIFFASVKLLFIIFFITLNVKTVIGDRVVHFLSNLSLPIAFCKKLPNPNKSMKNLLRFKGLKLNPVWKTKKTLIHESKIRLVTQICISFNFGLVDWLSFGKMNVEIIQIMKKKD